MTRSQWLTPDAPASGYICRRLQIPNSIEFLALVTGALLSLQERYNWEEYGALTPAQTTALFQIMVDDFTFNSAEGCRVVGEIIPYAGTISPNPDWLLCEGQSFLRTDLPDLFTVIGTVYGAVDGSHFNLPDLRGRTVLGQGAGPGLTARAVGSSGGEEDHTLIIAEMPSHTHTDTGHTHAESTATPSVDFTPPVPPQPGAIPGVGITGVGNANLTNTGGDGAHNNMQPFLTLVYLIVGR